MRPKRSTAASHRRLGVGAAGDVQLDDQQVVRLADGLGHGVGVAAGGDDRVAGGQGRLREVDAHAAAGAGNKPNFLFSHGISLCSLYNATPQETEYYVRLGVSVRRGGQS